MTKVCLAVRDGDTRPGADVMYRPCSAFFTGSDQNWRVLQQPHGEWAFVNTRSGLVAGVRAGSTATGARLELQRDTGAAYQCGISLANSQPDSRERADRLIALLVDGLRHGTSPNPGSRSFRP